MSKTKIVVLQLKEIVYTAIFIALGILLILLLIFMFVGKDNSMNAETSTESMIEDPQYVAGVYTSSLTLHENVLNLEVVVDENHINSVRLLNIDEAISTMYPLVEPGLSKIEEQLVSGVSIDQLEYQEDCQYTQMLLVHAIQATLDKATPVEPIK